jgi:CheY-like chemotaxis protein
MKLDKEFNAIKVLIVEDSKADLRLTMEALKDCKLMLDIEAVKDGVEAMDFLRKKGEYKNSSKPDLILLDLNLPRKDGKKVLEEIKSDAHLKRIPVVILTVSSDEQDIIETYDLHANCFITKPVDLNQFIQVVKSIESFWFTIVNLPPNITK